MKTNRSSLSAVGPFIATRRPMSRRHFLRGTGVALALPWLEAMLPSFARAQPSPAPDAKPRRMFAVMQNLGFIPGNFFPFGHGRGYKASPYFELIEDFRNDFTVFSGVALPHVNGGDAAQDRWLTGAPWPSYQIGGTFPNTISLDQVVARHLGHLTRFPSLTLAVNGSTGLSFGEAGGVIRPEQSGAAVYQLLFVDGSPLEREEQARRLEGGQSILDTLNNQAKELMRDTGPADRDRLDQYFTGVRTLERNLQASRAWAEKPKPKVAAPMPVDPETPGQYFEKITIMYQLATLAFQTDSTRAITLLISSRTTPVVEGSFAVPITEPYFRLARHGDAPARLAQLRALEVEHFKQLNALLAGLKAVPEEGETLLDRTQLLWGSNFNDYNWKVQTNLPIVFAGGGWKHGQYLNFEQPVHPLNGDFTHAAVDLKRNYPLTNLHLSMLHRMGIAENSFATSTGEFQGLEMA